jgi:very-short-patch-repair endonuclease
VSAAFHQNSVPVVQELSLTNGTGSDIADLEIIINTEPAFIAPCTIRADRIAAGVTQHFPVPNVKLDAPFLRRLTEGLTAEFVVTVKAGGNEVETLRTSTRLHAPSHWGGSGAAPELVAAFVRPNDPVIDAILHDASLRLTRAGKDGALSGYRGGRRERTWDIGSAVWSALAAHGITYVLPPASFERFGQKVRSPSDVLERKTGTCFDLALLYAAVLEQVGLNPVVVLTRGHAFVGLWLKPEEFSSAVIDDMQLLRKRRDMEDLIFIETTALTSSPPARFREAVLFGSRHVDEKATEPLEVAVDIRRTRATGITPLDLGERHAGPIVASSEAVPIDLELEAAPTFIDEHEVEQEAEEPVDRLERWKRKLLDLTLRNKLLNFTDGKKSVTLECPEPARLEDLLAAGEKFKLMPRSGVLADGDQRDAELFREQNQTDGRTAFLNAALEARELYTTLPERELEDRLTDLYRMTRTAFEEGGANILFLAMGFLKWVAQDGAPPHLAPLLLVPVGLQRSSVRAGYRLVLHEDEARFNPTLLEMLRQDFELKMPELEKGLPIDSSGLDLARIWQIVRSCTKDLKGWEVTGRVVLSAFSFTKFLMWRDLVDRMEVLKQNPIVRHLVETPKEIYGDGQDGFPQPQRIDHDYHPSDLFAPLSADSSQLAAVLAAAKGKDFVLFGPPGTGKSQTIANIISQCLTLGKTVLFVSQKTAALEVVQRRLNDIGLGDYCLEVHSAKAQKSAVLSQLKTSWQERSTAADVDWTTATSELARLRDELNALVQALHTRHQNGLSAYEAFGLVIANRDRFPALELDWSTEPDSARLAELSELCRELTLLLRDLGDPADHSLSGIAHSEWSNGWRHDLERAIDAAISALSDVERTMAGFASATDLQVGSSWAAMRGLLLLASFLGMAESRNGAGLIQNDVVALRDVISELEGLQSKMQALTATLATSYRPAVYDQNLSALLAEWIAACNSNLLFRGSRQKKVKQALQPFATGQLPADVGPDIATLMELSGVVPSIESLGTRLSAFGAGWSGIETNVATLKEQLDWVDRARRAAIELAPLFQLESSHLLERIAEIETTHRHRAGPEGDIGISQTALKASWNAMAAALAEVGRLTESFDADQPPFLGENWAVDTARLFRRWREGLGDGHRWCRWQQILKKVSVAGLDPLVTAVSRDAIPAAMIVQAFEVGHARWWSHRLVDRNPVLRSFLAVHHEDTIERFRAADERIGELSKRIVRAKLAGTVPPPNAFGKDQEWGTLARELIKKQRHMPLRQLFASIPTALTRLTPCVMMSPLSIAQYLPPDSRPFDLVIFDEASQIPVWDAVGAIARGRQVIIAGDPEQLPPTSVGERGVDEIEDGTDIEDQESILSECIASNIPPRRLDWHYRSRHESLIAFSNRHYYQGRLVTFPSPVTEDRAVRYFHVPHGVYERGSGRVNREEARVVVAELIRRLRNPNFELEKRSIGIVTFNGEQQRLIENLLDAERRSDPALEMYFDRWHEPVFVKNLENVQGDERDTIFFSVAVAPDASGRPVSTISSLNKDGGYRRLNVAITRARKEMVVFATLRPDQIDLGRTRARGVRDFKHFLEFAERGPRAFVEAAAPTADTTESPFEDAVKAALEAHGWTVHTQIGVSGFRIDLGIVHPDAAGRYLAGVECDGATYHRSATARDRDRLRENVLTGLGWRIRRVWSTEWWQDTERAVVKLHDQLTADLEADRSAIAQAMVKATDAAPPVVKGSEPAVIIVDAESVAATAHQDAAAAPHESDGNTPNDQKPATRAADPTNQEVDNSEAGEPRTSALPTPAMPQEPTLQYARIVRADTPDAARPYQIADPASSGCAPDPELFYDPLHRKRIRAMVSHVIEIEGPIYEDLLVQRLARAHGFSRAAGRIREVVVRAIDDQNVRTIDDDRTLVWPKNTDAAAPVYFRSAPTDIRDHNDIPLVELRSLALTFVADGADHEEAVRRMAAEFGLGKLRENTRRRFERALSKEDLSPEAEVDGVTASFSARSK